MPDAEYVFRVNEPITAAQFATVLRASTLGERRPVDDMACIEGMLRHANLLVSAWQGDDLVGVARSLTDFHYACYLSDLAVHVRHQKRGIGRRLLAITQEQLGERCKLILFAAPAANGYYERLGFTHNSRGWILERGASLRG